MIDAALAPDARVGFQLMLATGLIVLTIAVHVAATLAVIALLRRSGEHASNILGNAPLAVPLLVALATLGMLVAHTIEIWGWAAVLLLLGQFPNLEAALYFSVVTFTTLGYGDIVLGPDWRLLGAMASVNGIILFGWTTAVVVAVLTSAIEQRDARRREGAKSEGHRWEPWHPHVQWRPHVQDVRHHPRAHDRGDAVDHDEAE
ncbi:potassium channel family protein [Tistrella bauzanensis]|jgi:voltage-gated potassium channel Kch|uniref:Potassium channel family protein n=1 Tax=Tistrella arctica TaxID=3133430 RepID=A0ABU9YJZ6_9PROT